MDKNACQCDSLLTNVGVTSCNLDNATTLRPANNWISADTNAVTNSHTYFVSLLCRFDYYLFQSSYLNLTHSVSLIGLDCCVDNIMQHGLSDVFGSPKCRACSNYSLLIIAPAVIITFVMIVLIFMFNLTGTNGTINNFIFYTDIVGINMERYYPYCYNVVCIFTPSHTLDVCFYNGMNSSEL